MKFRMVSLSSLLFVLLPFTSAEALSARDIAEKTFPSVVLVVVGDSKGVPIALGSGFFVRKGVIATNYHVIKGAHIGLIKFADDKEIYRIEKVIVRNVDKDLVLLGVDEKKASPLPVGDSSHVFVGDTVYAVGNPRGLEGTISQGILSSSAIRNIGTRSYIQITAPISPGSSGGPVLNTQGEVIGIAAAQLKGQNLNMAIPSSYLVSLLRSVGFSTGSAEGKVAGKEGRGTEAQSEIRFKEASSKTAWSVIGHKGSKIYHLPGCPNYARIGKRNQVPFDSEQAAQKAGFRKAKNCPR